jgi:hypothetical protein
MLAYAPLYSRDCLEHAVEFIDDLSGCRAAAFEQFNKLVGSVFQRHSFYVGDTLLHQVDDRLKITLLFVI